MRIARLESTTWLLIFGGMALAGLGLAVRRIDPVVGTGIAVVGAVLVVAGIVLIVVRSRLPDRD